VIRTIVIASCIFVQGTFVRSLTDGRIVVAVGKEMFTGYPVGGAKAA
jgi:hypothetical protein